MISRRHFIASTSAGAALALGSQAIAKASLGAKPLRILVMGGTGFLGPHFVEAALNKGHQLTLFNRGKTNPGRFKDPRYESIEQLQGDRKSDLSALENKTWDAVLDTSAYLPADVTRSASLLEKAVQHYLIISTISVYAKMDKPGLDERSKLIVLPDPNVDKVSNETYGGLKALSEKAAEDAMPGKVTVVRPGLIVGPGDNTDRFTYWPVRVARGGDILAPESPNAPTQFIDVRDLANFLLHLIEQKNTGIFNADAQAGSITMGKLMNACLKAAPKAGKPVWVPADFLAENNVGPWMDLPCWIPAHGDQAGFGQRSAKKALDAGLIYRSLESTVRDTLAYWNTLTAERRAKPGAGLSAEREADVLAKWKLKNKVTS
ncbi:MAG: NAD-dependent epimerase/dehydratase family protein [Arenimonas sp.]